MSSHFMLRENHFSALMGGTLSFISQRRNRLSGFNSTFELQLDLALLFQAQMSTTAVK